LRAFISLPEPFPVPRRLQRLGIKSTRPWVAHVTPAGRHFEPYVANHAPTGARREYYPFVAEGALVEVNEPTAWHSATRYRLTRENGALTRRDP
jgi:hypothetical protein